MRQLAIGATWAHHGSLRWPRDPENEKSSVVKGESDHIVAELAARIFADLANPQTINRVDDSAWKVPFWRALSDAGLPLAWVPEKLGGAGASLAEGFALLGVAGRFAVAVPFAETLMAGWLLTCAELEAPDGAMTVAPCRPFDRIIFGRDATLSGRAFGVPFASEAENIAVVAQGETGIVVALVSARDCTIGEGRTLAGDASNIVRFERVKPLRHARAPSGFDRAALMLMGSVGRSVQTAGALESILSLTVSYAMSALPSDARSGSSRQSSRTSRGSLGKRRLRSQCRLLPLIPLPRTRVLTKQRSSRRLQQKSAAPKRQRKAQVLPIKCLVQSASLKNMSCIVSHCGC
jgi:hypothetical protein